ncbi:MAG TPA: MBL fold metallo-hydrolase [Planctomycetota bacterium]|nr:MBL fold metallo-hydrolase [Planctomycetota bacterium]
MARSSDRRPENVPGALFVDSTCIDCDTCRWMAPETFDRRGDMARVHAQPRDPAALARALQALVACPTGSIGTEDAGHAAALRAAREAFPVPVAGPVLHCGWHSRKSFGAASYLYLRPPERGGNVLVDSPRWSGALVRRLEALGGVGTLFLTHIDDVADHVRFAAHFGARRVLHARDVDEGTRDVELLLEGEAPIALDDDLLALPVPGHTAGSTCLLAQGQYLFTGDHLAWSERLGHLYAFRSACWYDWDELVRSMERLVEQRFEWVLPGHGRRAHVPPERFDAEIARLLDWLRTPTPP